MTGSDVEPGSERLDIGHDDPPQWWERRRARSIGAVVVVASTLLALGIGTAELLLGHRADSHRAQAASPSRQPDLPPDLMAERAQSMNGFRQVSFRAVSLIVPSYWGRNEVTDCGLPYADTVLYPTGPTATKSCDSVLSGRHSYVAFDASPCSGPGRLHRDLDLTRRLGQAVRTSGAHRQHDMYVVRVELGGTASCVEVSSPYRPVVERLVGTLRPRTMETPGRLGSLESR